MTIPPSPLRLFAPNFADHIDASTQVDRMPGVDAPCVCGREDTVLGCVWPFCKPPEKEDE